MIVAGISMGILVAIGGFVIGIWAAIDPTGNPVADIFLGDVEVETTGLPGDARAFDPFEALPAVTEYAGEGARLVSIEVGLVRSDGTQDLEANYTPQPDTTYTFAREVPRPEDAPPPGAGGANTGAWFEEVTVRAYEPGQRRQVTTTTGNRRTTIRYTNKGMERTEADPAVATPAFVEAPACDITDLWAVAIEQGAPADGVARVTYDADGYQFSVTGFVLLQFDQGCDFVPD